MISIITPVLNGAEFIEKNIKSIQELDIPHEHIIVDGGSTDNTLLIISKYKNVKLLHQTEKGGMYQAIDAGFNNAQGKYITWVNSDDMIISDGFTKMYNHILSSQVDLVYSNAFFVNKSEQIIKKVKGKPFAKYLFQKGIFPFVQPASIYKKDLYFKVGGLDYDNFKITGDLDLFLKFSRYPNVTFNRINVFSIKFLKYGESLGDRNVDLGNIEKDRAKLPRPNIFDRALNKILNL